MTKKAVDLVVDGAWLLTMAADIASSASQTADGAVAIDAGRVVATGTRAQILDEYQPAAHESLPHHILLPGLVNAHGHAAMSLFRGYAEDTPLQSWLQDRIWPLESKFVSSEFARDGVRLAILEMLRAGITSFSDMYFYPDITAREARAAGLRAQVAFPVIDFPNVWSSTAEEGIHKGLALHDEFRHEPLIDMAFGPHSVYSVARGALEQVLMYSEELDLNVQIHLHENAAEVAETKNRFGMSGIRHLHSVGLLSPRLQAVHVTLIEPAELDLFAAANVRVVHCPTSNAKLASGLCPTTQFLKAGVTVGLGTDSAASNNRLSLLAEARLASLLAKLFEGDAAALSAATVLSMATLDGARVLGLEDQVGSLEPGKYADLIAIDTRAPELQPLYDPLAQLLHAGGDSQVTHVWVGGDCLLRDRAATKLDEAAIVASAASWRERITGNA